MKTISLLQPWASLVIIGAKKIETRSWSTDYRGRLLIHASKSKKGSSFSKRPPFRDYIKDFDNLPFGMIIGEVNLDRILRIEDFGMSKADMDSLTLEERAFGDYTPDRYGWVFTNPVEYENKIPARGQLRLWDFHY